MNFEVIELPFSKDALAPAMSAETLEFHYEKHHKGYMKKLEAAIGGTDDAKLSLEDFIKKASGGNFNNAAQVFNHNFFWQSLKPGGGGAPTGDLADAITRDFGSFDSFKEQFKKAAATQFGSGWAWLVKNGDKLEITATGNAETPITTAATPLLTIDVWEHAYYIDHRNNRGGFIDVYLDKMVNWDFAASNL